ncbi:hypothetical protein BDD30_2955 [Photorhabdus asymbiotica]|uniref:Uncharacterized protein n=1 Tax=Photorhabdus asymbiotica TaxID=291112 RepID=A0ABX9SM85_9GAMM|nr:hypothetical protein BDD30_2955 [Photorhabdus asymbiotica]
MIGNVGFSFAIGGDSIIQEGLVGCLGIKNDKN